MKIENLDLKFETIYKQVSSKKFLNLQGLSGEIPFFISTYNPAQENEVSNKIKILINRLKTNGITALEIDLYDVTITILQKRKLLERIKASEKSMGKSRLFSALQNVLDAKDHLIPEIEKRIEENDKNDTNDSKLVLISGVGKVYPYIRSHTILNNLQNSIKDRPMLLFFPGVFDGRRLTLFGKIEDDNYYRANNLEHYSTG
ncbi:MAG TPA: DUF1788 domain-containing protein [Campylobacterales bacterium]|nr:DUF1788 domain-containing protein [Campylobacterales bacterium]